MADATTQVSHTDDPNNSTTMRDGTEVTNKTAEEYWENWDKHPAHSIVPDAVLAQALANLDESDSVE